MSERLSPTEKERRPFLEVLEMFFKMLDSRSFSKTRAIIRHQASRFTKTQGDLRVEHDPWIHFPHAVVAQFGTTGLVILLVAQHFWNPQKRS